MLIINSDLKSGGYSTSDYTIIITQKTYESLHLFYYVRYSLNPKTKSLIFISRKNKLYGISEKIEEPVKHVDLFYSILKPTRILVLGIIFEKSSKYFELLPLKSQYKTVNISNIIIHEDKLCEKLIDISDKINKKTTYILDNKERYNSIDVLGNTTTLPKFSTYTHTSKTYGSGVKDPIVIYDKDIFEPQLNSIHFKGKIKSPKQKPGNDEFDFKKIDYIKVYFSNVGRIIILVEILITPVKYYFSRRHKYGKSWIQVKIKTDSVYGHLVENERRLIYSFIVLIHKKQSYKNVETENATKIGISDKEDEKTIKVGDDTADELKEHNYVCYDQNLGDYYEFNNKKYNSLLNDKKHNSAFTPENYSRIYIYNFNIRIDIYDGKNDKDYLSYLRGYRLNVFFHKYDNYPLLIGYGDNYYGATTIEDYFRKWIHLKNLNNTRDPSQILIELKRINKMLNEANINKTQSYGICDEIIDKRFDTIRINVSSKLFQKDKSYLMVTHSPKNKCIIGKSWYKKGLSDEDIIDYRHNAGLSVKPTHDLSKIDIDGISATVYYFKYDKDYHYPLLIEYKIEEKKYRYYVLNNDDFKQIQCGPDDKDKIDDDCLNQILNHQNFFYNKVIDIRLEKQCMYTCCDDEETNKEYLYHVSIHKNKYKYCKIISKNNSLKTNETIPIICSSIESALKLPNGYKVFKHTIKTIKSDNGVEIRDTEDHDIKIKGFKINDNFINLYDYSFVEQIQISETYRNTYYDEIYVCFYQEDPRPLLLYYDQKIYFPMSKELYYDKWIQVQNIKNLEYNGKFCLQNKQVFDQLYKVIGFLNPVRLDENIIIDTGKKVQTNLYTIHVFNTSLIQINLKSEKLKRNRHCCYRKLVHTHSGINGITKNGKGFRLGDIVYNKGSDLTNHTLNFDPSKPLKSVAIYYYEHDKTFKHPLLVWLNCDTGVYNESDQELHKLTNISGLTWEKETVKTPNMISGPYLLMRYLDGLRYRFKKVVKIELQINKSTKYELQVRESSFLSGPYTTLATYNQLDVQEYLHSNSEKLKFQKYICFQHKLSNLGPRFDYNEIAGIDFTLPGQNGYIPIKLYKSQDPKLEDEISRIFYDPCLGDIYVFLYQNDKNSLETVPLLIYFNQRWYRPRSMDEYFNKWINISYNLNELIFDKSMKPNDYDMLINILDETNKDLNQVNLEVTNGIYGLPTSVMVNGKSISVSRDFKTQRIEVTPYRGTNTSEELMNDSEVSIVNGYSYLMVKHTTVNKGTVGHIRYHSKRIYYGQGDPFSVTKGTNFVNVYYHKCDSSFNFPLLMGLGQVNGDENLNVTPIEFYERLSGTGYELKFKKLDQIPKAGIPTRDKINEIYYSINHSVKIQLDYKNDDGHNSGYPLKLFSPGSESSYEVKDGTKITVSPSQELLYSKQPTGFKYYTHTIPENDGKPDGIYIGKIKIIIPNDVGKETEIHITGTYDNTNSNTITTPLYYSRCSPNLFVYFYGQDPRPLLFCYDNMVFRPISIDDYFTKWVLDKHIELCPCDEYDYTLLSTLIYVTNFLNPVTINTNNDEATYKIHKFNNKEISIKVTKTSRSEGFCYNSYTHVHNGIGSGGHGFRLGYLLYNKANIHDIDGRAPEQSVTSTNFKSTTHSSFDEVLVYYYKLDETQKNPLLIVLKNSTADDQFYYELQKATSEDKHRMYKKQTGELKLEEKPGTFLETILDTILFHISKSLEVNLSFRETTKPEKPDSTTWEGTYSSIAYYNFEDKLEKSTTSIQVKVSGPTDILDANKKQTGYLYYRHMLSEIKDGLADIGRLRLLLFDGQYDPLTLYQRDSQTSAEQQITPLLYTSCKGDLYTYFYCQDPRPLMLCYNGKGYCANDMSNYTQKWCLVNGIESCNCSESGFQPETTLKNLHNVSMFLNPVHLNPLQIPFIVKGNLTASDLPKPDGTTNITYNLHQFSTKNAIQMKITKTKVNCYNKYTYEPIGTTGKGDGFRLGTAIYRDSLTVKPEGTVNYTNEGGYKYQPLKTVEVYYYDNDRKFEEPLFVVLHFGNIGVVADNRAKEYWKLTRRDINIISWQSEKSSDEAVSGCQDKLVRYLDKIRYSLKKLIRIEIQHNSEIKYDLTCRSSTDSPGSGFSTLGARKKIEVVECSDSEFSKLKYSNYICFKHKLTELQFYDYHKIGGVVMTLPGKGLNEALEISLYDSNDHVKNVVNDQPKQLTYNTCMTDVFVYFYCKHGTNSPDKSPLMLRYNDSYYRPDNRDDYLTKWVHDRELDNFKVLCGLENKVKYDIYETLLEKLNIINVELNRIDLTQSDKYGIPTDKSPGIQPDIDLTRVKVTKIPKVSKDNRPYVKLVHRTSNGLMFGQIWYGNKEIVAGNGIKFNGIGDETTIKIDTNRGGKNNHVDFIKANKPNTVVTYYSIHDTHYTFPQLILLMTTTNVGDPIKASAQTRFGYYVLCDGLKNSEYKYEWRETTEQPPRHLVLNYETELTLLNSVVILLEKRPNSGGTASTYGDDKIDPVIKNLIDSNSITPSPGLDKDINRLKGKEVRLKEETGEGKGDPCLKNTGFKAITHDISEIVDPKIHGAPDVTLIAILRFMIPTSEGDGKYIPLNLYDSLERKQIVTLFHQNNQNCLCVYFYCQDPRPLMVIYNDLAYIPYKLKNYFTKWVFDNKPDNSYCNKIGEPILRSLVYVSNILNPVNIMKGVGMKEYKRVYDIHKFNGENISINVTEKPSDNKFCYNQYIHTHTKEGFRLGNITYNSDWIVDRDNPEKCIDSLTSDKPNYDPAPEVAVYYYRGDKTHKNPLLVALCSEIGGGDSSRNGLGVSDTTRKYKFYYKLISCTSVKRYKKVDKPIELLDKCDSHLGQTLEKIRFEMSKTLVLMLNKRHNYNGYVYENNNKLDSYSKRQVPVQVTVNNKFTDSAYKYYEHNITNVDRVDEIGRLELFLSDDTKNNFQNMITFKSSSYVEEVSIDPLFYSICKGNICVFLPDDTKSNHPNTELPPDFKDFPLMLNFNEVWYGPKDFKKLSEWTQINEMNLVNHKFENKDFEKIQKQLDKAKNLLKTENFKNKPSERSVTSQEDAKFPKHNGILLRSEDNYINSETIYVSKEEEVNRGSSIHPETSNILIENEQFTKTLDSEESTNHIDTVDLASYSRTSPSSSISDTSLDYMADEPLPQVDELRAESLTQTQEPVVGLLSTSMEYPNSSPVDGKNVSLHNFGSSNGNRVDIESKATYPQLSYSTGHKDNQEGFTSIPQEFSSLPGESKPQSLGLSASGQILDSYYSNQLIGYSIGGTIASIIIIGLAAFILLRRYRKIELKDMIPILY